MENNRVEMKQLIVFQTAYSYSEMLEDSLEVYFTSKDLDGYFSKVITVNPIASYTDYIRIGRMDFNQSKVIEHDRVHTFIEGSHARWNFLGKFPRLNFILAQIDLLLVILKVIDRGRIQFVRAEDPRFCGLWGFILAKIIQKPLLVGVWGNPNTMRQLLSGPMSPKIFRTIYVEKVIEKFILRNSNLALAQNDDNLNFIINSGIPREKTAIFRLGNGIHKCHFTEPKTRSSNTDWYQSLKSREHKIVVSVGQLEKRKLHEDALKVIRILKDNFNIKYYIAGEGSQRQYYEDLAHDLNIVENVVFLGKIPQQDIAALVAIADLVLSPLTGRALTEALLGSAPVVAYDIDCHPELIQPGMTGELVEYRNYHEMAVRADYILTYPDYGRTLGRNAREATLNFMNPANIINEQVRIYETLLHK